MRINFRILSVVLIFSALFILLLFSSDIFIVKKVILKSKVKTAPAEAVLKWLSFSGDKALKEWKNKVFKGKTQYWIDQGKNEFFLHSKSEKTASALYHLASYNINNYPFISWEWIPLKFPDKEGITDPKLKDDYALRLYVIFASGFFTNFRCVEYLWDSELKEGTKQISPYSDKIMQFVVRSGNAANGWVVEERNVLEDYISLFGEKPTMKVRAIAIMSDSEGTQDSCEAYFKEIKIIKKL